MWGNWENVSCISQWSLCFGLNILEALVKFFNNRNPINRDFPSSWTCHTWKVWHIQKTWLHYNHLYYSFYTPHYMGFSKSWLKKRFLKVKSIQTLGNKKDHFLNRHKLLFQVWSRTHFETGTAQYFSVNYELCLLFLMNFCLRILKLRQIYYIQENTQKK